MTKTVTEAGRETKSSERESMLDQEQGALAMARGIISVFGAFLDSRVHSGDGPVQEPPPEGEWRELITKLQDTTLLALSVLPEELRVAIGHIDGENPERTLGYVREAFVRSCSFVRAQGMV